MARYGISALYVFLCCVYVHGQSKRFGTKSPLPPLTESQKWGEKFRVLQFSDISKDINEVEGFLPQRLRRSAPPAVSSGAVHSSLARLDDNHTMLIVHWAGERSSVIIALAKSYSQSGHDHSSRVYVSKDYGVSFTNITDKIKNSSENVPLPSLAVDKYYNSDRFNSHYIFTDVHSNCVFMTRDYTDTFSARCNLPFKPQVIAMNPANPDHILAFDPESFNSDLYLSKDFGQTWRRMHSQVKSFFWGISPHDPENTVYIEEKLGTGSNNILHTNNYVTFESIINNVEDFEVREEYMFATKRVNLLGARYATVQFWVSYNRKPFVRALFPSQQNYSDFYVADASEDQVMVCATHDNNITHLYISDVQGSHFSLSLENIVYFNPHGANRDTWLSYFADETFADIHKVAGLRGIYIASQIINPKRSLNLENQRTLISYDKGGEWELLSAPHYIHNISNNCSKELNCSLHLSQQFTRYYPGNQAQTILSQESAPGIIVASGTVGGSLKSQYDMFLSNDAGFSWYQVLEGNFMVSMADHGGVLLAVKQYQQTDTVYYSINEGQQWFAYKFLTEGTIRVYGLLTEPGEKTTVFSLFGSYPDFHSWILIQINMSAVLGVPCTDSDYKDWTLPEENPDKGCLLGRKIFYQRRNTHAHCYNGNDFVRVNRLQNCSCVRDDFECDFGWELLESSQSQECKRDNDVSAFDINQIPVPCPPGTLYQYSHGYRKVSGDTCSGGQEYQYAPLEFACPIPEMKEFMLVASRNHIQALDLVHFQHEDMYTLPAGETGFITAVAFDYIHNRLFWSKAQPSRIQSLLLGKNSNRTSTTLNEGRMQQVTSIAYDWTANTVFWTDEGERTIEVMHSNGQFRKHLIANNSQVVRPGHLVLDPHHGYMFWLETQAGEERVMKAWMDGSNIASIGPSPLTNVPQGLTLDLTRDRLYWTQRLDGSVRSMNVEGKDLRQLDLPLQGAVNPGPIAVYKDDVYWINNDGQRLMVGSEYSAGIAIIAATLTEPTVTMLIISNISQSSRSACNSSSPGCSQLCMPRPHPTDNNHQNRTCMCGDDYLFEVLGSGDQQCVVPTNASCNRNQFSCRNGRCIPGLWRCDREDDCGDFSDEIDCPYTLCPNNTVKCANGRCIPLRWKCDHDDDCRDGHMTDEQNCTQVTCGPGQFTCRNNRCITITWKCDFDNDCRDGSDEENCFGNYSCNPGDFTCTNGECVAGLARCNGQTDCSDGSDEINCGKTSCQAFQFACTTGSTCIFSSWRCDGDRDCSDNSDEVNCPYTSRVPNTTTTPLRNHTCGPDEYQCASGFCIDSSSECDQIDDCGDGSDEIYCDFIRPTLQPNCSREEFRCVSGQCISASQKCDGQTHCVDGSDEVLCFDSGCGENKFQCNTSNLQRRCIWNSWVCDGTTDCPRGEDELHCDHIHCVKGEFRCLTSGNCIPMSLRCNRNKDCTDGTDEFDCIYENCTKYTDSHTCCAQGCIFLNCTEDHVVGCFTNKTSISNSCSYYYNNKCPTTSSEKDHNGNYDSRIYFKCSPTSQQVPWMSVCDSIKDCENSADESLTCALTMSPLQVEVYEKNGTAFILWSGERIDDLFIVSYFPTKMPMEWKNMTTNETNFQIKDLKPATDYTISVYVKRWKVIFHASKPVHFTTQIGKPTPPLNVHSDIIFQMNKPVVRVTWQPPVQENSFSLQYLVIVKAQNILEMTFTAQNTTLILTTLVFGLSYEITVKAMNEKYVSDPSNSTHISLQNYKPVVVSTSVISNSSVSLNWTANSNATRYYVTAILPYQSDREIQKMTNNTNITFDGLCPGQNVLFFVSSEYQNGPNVSSELISATTNGIQVQAVKEIKVEIIENNVANVSFIRPSNLQTTCTIFYVNGTDLPLAKFLEQSWKVTMQQSESYKKLPNQLVACESYIFRVICGPDTCPVSYPFFMHTEPDAKSSPKNLRYKTFFQKESGQLTLKLMWDAPCKWLTVNMRYIIERSMMGKLKEYPTTSFTSHTDPSFDMPEVTRGVSYNFRVKTTQANANFSSSITVNIPNYPAPENIKVTYYPNSTVQIFWSDPLDKPLKENFVGYNVTILQNDKTIVSRLVTTTYLLENLTVDYLYDVSVYMIIKDGPPGLSSSQQFYFLIATPDSPLVNPKSEVVISLSKTNLVAILVPLALVFVALVTVIMVFVVRHRRLQRSFLAFANSHYNTRSGATTFSTELDGADDPMIQGFSDDEPLIIA